MKLVATTTALVAALSLFGCATDNDGEGGGHLAGLRPAKPSLDDPKTTSSPGLNPAIEHILNGGLVRDPRGGNFVADPEISAETMRPPFPMDGVCEVCDIVVLHDRRIPGEINVLDQYGRYFCTFWVDESGRVVDNNCR